MQKNIYVSALCFPLKKIHLRFSIIETAEFVVAAHDDDDDNDVNAIIAIKTL